LSFILHLSPPSSFSSLSCAAIFNCCVVVVCRPSYCRRRRRHVASCHHCILLSSLLLSAGLHCPLPNAGCFLFVRRSHGRRSVIGKQTNDWCPLPPISCRCCQTFPFFAPHCPCPQVPPPLWVDVGRRGAWVKVSYALFDCCHRGRPSSIVPIISIRRQSSTVHRRVISRATALPDSPQGNKYMANHCAQRGVGGVEVLLHYWHLGAARRRLPFWGLFLEAWEDIPQNNF
jgi:hypothetical protein